MKRILSGIALSVAVGLAAGGLAFAGQHNPEIVVMDGPTRLVRTDSKPMRIPSPTIEELRSFLHECEFHQAVWSLGMEKEVPLEYAVKH